MRTTFEIRNGKLLYEEGQHMVLRLVEPSIHGDPRDMGRRGPIPAGKYKVIKVWQNYYGLWVRVRYGKSDYDIEPERFEWYHEDQAVGVVLTEADYKARADLVKRDILFFRFTQGWDMRKALDGLSAEYESEIERLRAKLAALEAATASEIEDRVDEALAEHRGLSAEANTAPVLTPEQVEQVYRANDQAETDRLRAVLAEVLDAYESQTVDHLNMLQNEGWTRHRDHEITQTKEALAKIHARRAELGNPK